jgi:hypothetical protein
MARIVPDSEKTRVIFSSQAEEQFYGQCRATLSDGWRVWHSRTLSTMEGDEGLKDNEIDFVCYHPKHGVIVVEVKGGRIRFDASSNTYSSINRHGESFAIKDPFAQALNWKSRFLRYLKRHGIRVPVSHAVAFPTALESEFPETASNAHEIIIGRNRMKDLDSALATIAHKCQPEQYLSFQDVGDALDKLLVGQAFTTRLYLRDYLDSHDHRLKDIEAIHETLITPIASSRRLGIEGEAGTGKTMLALMLARHFRDDHGKSVLILGSNALLNLLLQRDLGPGIDVQTYPELAQSFGINLLIPPDEYTGSKEDWIQYEAPDRLKKAISGSSRRYQVVICDEAQDVQPFWWEAFESILVKAEPGTPDAGAEDDSRLYLFFDPGQGVFGSGGEAKFAKDVLPIPAPYFPLVHNYRTTREIATFARGFRTTDGVLKSHCGRLGYVPELVVYKDAEEARQLLAQLMKKLTREEGLATDELTILSARNPSARESVLYQVDELSKIPLHRYQGSVKKGTWREARPAPGAVGISTIAGFKGLETPVGILLNVSEYNLPADNPIMASLIYVACTRAKHMLYVFVQADDPKRLAFERALAAIKQTGSMVIEGSKADFEFSGRVMHYNPERVGFLAVDDPGFSQGSVMFFPSDVARAQIKDLKPGTRVKFRPRVEGHLTIAGDLALVQVS